MQPSKLTAAGHYVMIAIALVCAMLFADGLGIVEKPGALMTSAKDGLISDLARCFPFFLAGILLSRLRKSFWHVVMWVIALNLIDKVFVGLRAATLPNEIVTLQMSNLLIGLVFIFAVTLPLGLLIGAAGYSLRGGIFAIREPTDASPQARFAIYCALCAIVVPFVDMLNGYALNSIAEIPIFYLSFSSRTVPVLYWVFIGGATVSLILYLIEAVVQRRARSILTFLSGIILLLVALLLFKGLWGLWAQ